MTRNSSPGYFESVETYCQDKRNISLHAKRFVYVSLVYLGLAAAFGILKVVTNIGYIGQFALAHFNLLGFMFMMFFGVAYLLLPRFSRTDLRFPGWVPVHFWLANGSLVSMVIFRSLQISSDERIYSLLFLLSASVQVISIVIFIVNIWMTLAGPVQTGNTGTHPGKADLIGGIVPTQKPATTPVNPSDKEETGDQR